MWASVFSRPWSASTHTPGRPRRGDDLHVFRFRCRSLLVMIWSAVCFVLDAFAYRRNNPMGVVAYPSNFIAGVTTVLVLYDEDGANDFGGHTKAVASFSETGKVGRPWVCGPVTLIPTVNPVVALFKITPPTELPGCLGRLFIVVCAKR